MAKTGTYPDLGTAPSSWADWSWPDWVPAKVRHQVEGFWAEKHGRGPRAWIRDMHDQGAPAFGSMVTLPGGFSRGAPLVTGRYVHAWNNIGRLVLDDADSFAYTDFGPADRPSPAGD